MNETPLQGLFYFNGEGLEGVACTDLWGSKTQPDSKEASITHARMSAGAASVNPADFHAGGPGSPAALS